MKKTLAISAAKLAQLTATIRRRGGTTLPGYIAENIDPQIQTKLSKANFPQGIILVTGTNGKTTTSRAIAAVLEEAGISYLHNQAGSNLSRGVISAILKQSSIRGRSTAQVGLFEVDEGYIPDVCAALRPKTVVVTNLFRDQLDRYGELDSIASKFRATFAKTKPNLILNADDPLVASLGSGKPATTYFGISDEQAFTPLEHDHTADSLFDPTTGEKLTYSSRYFGHIGKYRSKNGKFSRPEPQIDVVKLKKSGLKGFVIEVKTTTELLNLSVNIPGAFNIYNFLPAVAIAESLGVISEVIASAVSNTAAAFGRAEEISLTPSLKVGMYLIKNPTGFNQVIQSFISSQAKDPLLLVINDNFADGRDVSWLWDSAVEDFAGREGTIIISGSRAEDMALRLSYAGSTKFQLVPKLEEAFDIWYKLAAKQKAGLIVPTYTAMLAARGLINRQFPASLKEKW